MSQRTMVFIVSSLAILVWDYHAACGSEDTIGPNGIQSKGLGLSGSGVAIGQVENGRPGKHGLDIDPARLNDTIRPTEVFIGDNSISTPSATDPFVTNHAEAVAGVMISTDAIRTGVSTGAMLYSAYLNPRVDADFQEDVAIAAAHLATLTSMEVRAINLSIGLPLEDGYITDGNSKITLFVDWSAAAHDVLYVINGNQETDPPTDPAPVPADNYNGMTIAASAKVGSVYRAVADFNFFDEDHDAFGPRTSVSLLAPGVNVDMAGLNNTPIPNIDNDGTSFAAPHVTGSAALLQQFANQRVGTPRWDGERSRRHEVMKAVLMNSADKIEDNSGDGRFLGMERTVTDTNGFDWLDSEAYTTDDSKELPLDNQMGAGHLNTKRAVQQFAPGEYDNDTSPVPNIGWDYGTTSGEDDFNKYDLAQPIAASQFISITLAWDRAVEFDNAGSDPDVFEIDDTFVEDLPFNDLDLYLMPAGATNINQRITRSFSDDTTLEHIFFEITDPGMYEIWVHQFNEESGPQDYALAWWQGLASNAIFGDYSGDGTVGPEDFTFWKVNFGTTNPAADGNGNGVVDAADYTVWRNNLAPGSGGLASVPEPTAALLAVVGLICGLNNTRTGRRINQGITTINQNCSAPFLF